MQIAALFCPCNERPNPLNHYDSGACSAPPIPVAMIRSILAANRSDSQHRENKLTATRVLNCPRAVAIEDNMPNVLDVRQLNTGHIGTIVHRELAGHALPGEAVEVPVFGKLFGEEISGTCDLFSKDLSHIDDYKFHGETSQNFKFSGSVDPELAAQLNIYRLLREQEAPDSVKHLGVWHGAIVSARSKAPAWFYRGVPFLTEAEIARIKPNGSSYTIEQLVGQFVEFRNKLKSMSAADAIKAMPLVGREMWRGTKCTLYCAVKRTCDDIEGISSI